MAGTFAVVIFNEDNSVGVVPSTWLNASSTYWPCYTSQDRIDKAVKDQEQPKPAEGWKLYSTRILGIFGLYCFALHYIIVALHNYV